MDIEKIEEYLLERCKDLNISIPITYTPACSFKCLIEGCIRPWTADGWDVFLRIVTKYGGRMEDKEHRKLLDLLWGVCFSGSPEKSFIEFKKIYHWKFLNEAPYPDDPECKVEKSDFTEEEFEMHCVPRVFEALDYYLEKTEYKYNERFQTFCCHFGNIPYFHIAMDPGLQAFRRRLIVFQIYNGIEIEENDGEGREWIPFFDVVKNAIGLYFFIKRYPRFFVPEISKEKYNAFISEGERKLAYLFKKYILKHPVGSYEEFKENTRVIYSPSG